MQPPVISIDLARVILRRASCGHEPVDITQLHGGATEVYRINLANGEPPLVLKTYGNDRAWVMRKEALVAEWIGEHIGVPIPKWLLIDENGVQLPRPLALMTWLPGALVRNLIGSPNVEDAYRQMGAALRRLHALPMVGYGYIREHGVTRPRSSNGEHMAAAFESAFRRLLELGIDAGLVRKFESAVHARRGILIGGSGPVLCHNDLHQGNVLAARDERGSLRLTGLFDFADASAADPLFDLALSLFCCSHEDPASRPHILSGYGPIDHPEPETALWLYTLHHRAVMWCRLKRLSIAGRAADPIELLRDLDEMTA